MLAARFRDYGLTRNREGGAQRSGPGGVRTMALPSSGLGSRAHASGGDLSSTLTLNQVTAVILCAPAGHCNSFEGCGARWHRNCVGGLRRDI